METIYKYEITFKSQFELELPGGAKIMTVQLQQGKPCIWVLVNPRLPKLKRQFRFISTGNSIEETGLVDIGTLQFLKSLKDI